MIRLLLPALASTLVSASCQEVRDDQRPEELIDHDGQLYAVHEASDPELHGVIDPVSLRLMSSWEEGA